jgi:hypothetical protein
VAAASAQAPNNAALRLPGLPGLLVIFSTLPFY